MAEETN